MGQTTILDHPALSARLFYAWPNRFSDPLFVECKTGKLGCWRGGDFPNAFTLIHFHGNAETVADYLDDFAGEIMSMKMNLFLAEYRGYGMSEGEPALVSMFDDIPAIVSASGADPSRIIFFGRSLGSIFATHAAHLYPEAAGLVLESGIADPLEWILSKIEPRHLDCSADELRTEAGLFLNHQEKLAGFRGRTLIMHTRKDELIAYDHAVRFHSWAPEPKELVIFERGYHNNIMEVNRKNYFERLKKLNDLLLLESKN